MLEVVVEERFDIVGEEDTVFGREGRSPVLCGSISTPDEEGNSRYEPNLPLPLLR